MLHKESPLTELTPEDVKQLIKSRCLALLLQAQQRYNLSQPHLDKVAIACDLKGRSAGKIELRYQRFKRLKSVHLRFNLEAAYLDLNDMLENTLPHEVAHLVVFLCPKQFEQVAHGPDWQAVCIELGGNGLIYHQHNLSKARQQRRWIYRDSEGVSHQLSTIRHNRIQKGGVYRVKGSGAAIEAEGFYQEAI